jgi:hypothetical protein
MTVKITRLANREYLQVVECSDSDRNTKPMLIGTMGPLDRLTEGTNMKDIITALKTILKESKNETEKTE